MRDSDDHGDRGHHHPQADTLKMRLIFDCGGVLTARSRHRTLLDALAGDAKSRMRLERFMHSTWLTDCATGLHGTEDLIAQLAEVATRDNAAVRSALLASAVVDPGCLYILGKLAKCHELYLVSDSLPPYSDYVEAHLTPLFARLFLSDRVGLRKADGLFQYAEDAVPEFFAHAAYVDDNAANLAYPSERGATVFRVDSSTEFRELVQRQSWMD